MELSKSDQLVQPEQSVEQPIDPFSDCLVKFKKQLTHLINQHSLENMLEMPDFIMADLITNILINLHLSRLHNDNWHGMKSYPTECPECCDLTKGDK